MAEIPTIKNGNSTPTRGNFVFHSRDLGEIGYVFQPGYVLIAGWQNIFDPPPLPPLIYFILLPHTHAHAGVPPPLYCPLPDQICTLP